MLLLGTIRACGGVSLGMLCSYIAQKDFINEHLKAKNIIEIISTMTLVYMLIGKRHSFGNFAILIPMAIITICSKCKEGLISKILNGKIFQNLGKLSYEMYLYQAIVIYTMAVYVPTLKGKLLTATLTAIIYLFFICKFFKHLSIQLTDRIMRGGMRYT